MKMYVEHLYEHISPLEQYAATVTSQSGEDGIIAHIMKVIEPSNRYCVEFGAWDGKYLSNCHELLKNQNWHGLMIEGDPEKFKELVETYRGSSNVALHNGYVSSAGPDSLDNILTLKSAPKSFGLLSIDIDGNDYYVWEALNDFFPDLIVIEFNSSIPNDVVFVQEQSPTVNQGCSLLSLVKLGKEKGYELAVCTGHNAFFVKKEKFGLLGVENNFISTLYTPVQNGRIFQGYDSSIHVVGMDRLMWRGGVRIDWETFQLFPKEERVYREAPKQNRP